MSRNRSKTDDAPARTVSESPAFRVRIGTARPGAAPKLRGFIGRIKAMVREHGGGAARAWRRAHGGRGGSAAAYLPRRAAPQRVVVKTRIVKHSGYRGQGGAGAVLREHLSYLARRGASQDGERGVVFDDDRELTVKELAAFREALVPDRHHFRILVSPEFGSKLELQSYAREFVKAVAHDLDTTLTWVGVAHYDTDDPHLHLLVRGKTPQGQDLVVSRDYLSHGMRLQAMEIATRHLGPRLAQDIERSIERDLKADRVTARDRAIATQAAADSRGWVSALRSQSGSLAQERERLQALARLQYLESLGLAREVSAGIWQPDSRLLPRLKALSIRGDIIKTRHAHMKGDSEPYTVILGSDETPVAPFIGRVAARAHVDELWDHEYLLVEGPQGKQYYVPLARESEARGREAQIGAIVRIESHRAAADGEGGRSHLRVTRLSRSDLDLQTHLDGVTFLDRELARGVVPRSQDSRLKGFDADLAAALSARATYLTVQGLAETRDGRWRVKAGFLDDLYERELQAAHGRLEGRYGPLNRLVPGQRLQGTIAALEELSSGPHVIVAGIGDYTLVPAGEHLARGVGKRIRLSVGASTTATVLEPRALTLSVRYQFLDLKRTRGLGGVS